MIDLSRITLCAISSVKIPETLKAIEVCEKECIFHNILFFSDHDTQYGIKIPKINNIQQYNNFVLHELPKLVLPLMSDFLLTIHWDGFIINPLSWTDIFYEYDYIGAPWPWFKNICGNGGFCLKSKKFLLKQLNIISNKITTNINEDLVLCKIFRNHFIQNGCKYAEPEIAYLFSTEYPSPNPKYRFSKPFGFHDFSYHPQHRQAL
jgi:hypothetical protein